MILELSEEQAEQLYTSIVCRLGVIETGTPMVRATDVLDTNTGDRRKIKALSVEQMKIVILLEDLRVKLLNRNSWSEGRVKDFKREILKGTPNEGDPV